MFAISFKLHFWYFYWKYKDLAFAEHLHLSSEILLAVSSPAISNGQRRIIKPVYILTLSHLSLFNFHLHNDAVSFCSWWLLRRKTDIYNGMGLGGLSWSFFPAVVDSSVLPLIWLSNLVSWLKRVSKSVWIAGVCHTVARFYLTYLYVHYNKAWLHIPMMTSIRQLSRREM